jgi:hypothetical protein
VKRSEIEGVNQEGARSTGLLAKLLEGQCHDRMVLLQRRQKRGVVQVAARYRGMRFGQDKGDWLL